MRNLYGEERAACTQQELNSILIAHERYVAYQGGIRAQLAHTSLDGLNLANRNLSEADFAGSSLVGATLYGSKLERASLYCADLRGANLQFVNLTRADMRGASLKGATLADALMDGADLRAAMMMYVANENVSVLDRNRSAVGGTGSIKTANGVDFSNCSLKNVSFGNAKLDGADFTGALLQGAKFKGATLTNINLSGAVLTGVDLKELNVPASALEGCVTDISAQALANVATLKASVAAHQEWLQSGGARGKAGVLIGEDLRPLDGVLSGRMLAGIQLQKVIAIGSDFSDSQLQAVKFDGADLREADFTGADLRGASFRNARLSHARFDRANLGSMPMANGDALRPNFTGATAALNQFVTANLEDTLSNLGLAAASEDR